MNLNSTEKLIDKMIKEKDFDSYAVLVSKDGQERSLMSDNVNKDTYFDIASMGKVLVTSTLILNAVGNGSLSLDDTLDKFFDNVPDEEKSITIKQLLTHTSGIARCPILPESVAGGNEAFAKQIINNPLLFKPGTRQQYSCNGMILLGYIIEKIYGKTLEEVFNEKIKKPLGYTRSKFNIELDEPNAAVCYRTENVDGLAHPWDDENIRILQTSAGSGGQFFTLDDIDKFMKSVMRKDPVLYPKEIYDFAEKNYVGNLGEGWGLGWLIVDGKYNQSGKLFPIGSCGHCGHTGTSLFFNRKENLYVIILTNATRFANMKNDFKGYDYGVVEKMRENLHNAVYSDLSEQGLL